MDRTRSTASTASTASIASTPDAIRELALRDPVRALALCLDAIRAGRAELETTLSGGRAIVR